MNNGYWHIHGYIANITEHSYYDCVIYYNNLMDY